MADIPDRGPQLKAVNIFFLVVTLVAILLRGYVRLAMVKAFGIDDYLMVLATVRGHSSAQRTFLEGHV